MHVLKVLLVLCVQACVVLVACTTSERREALTGDTVTAGEGEGTGKHVEKETTERDVETVERQRARSDSAATSAATSASTATRWDLDGGGAAGTYGPGRGGVSSTGEAATTTTADEKGRSKEKFCKRCTLRQADKKRRLKTLKAAILRQTGMGTRTFPNITMQRPLHRVPTLQRLIEKMGMQKDAPYNYNDDWYDEEDTTRIVQIMTIADKPPDYVMVNDTGACYFGLNSNLRNSKIEKAELWMYIWPDEDRRKSHVGVNVYRIIQTNRTGLAEKTLIRSRKLKMERYGEWINFNISPVVDLWRKEPNTNYGLVIKARDENNNNRIATPSIPGQEVEYPVLDISISKNRQGRKRRTLRLICNEDTVEDRCCRHPLTIDFLELRWFWIIVPRTYEVNYCSGNCTIDIMEDTPHTYIPMKVSYSPKDSPCCTPTKEGSMNIIYYNTAMEIIYKVVNDVIVLNCGCR